VIFGLERLRTRPAPPSSSDLPIRRKAPVNPHLGSDEQMFGRNEQNPGNKRQ
jgi:hypothetical protein